MKPFAFFTEALKKSLKQVAAALTPPSPALINSIKQHYFMPLSTHQSPQEFKKAFLLTSVELVEAQSNLDVFIASLKSAWSDLPTLSSANFSSLLRRTSPDNPFSSIEYLLMDLHVVVRLKEEDSTFYTAATRILNACEQIMEHCEFFTPDYSEGIDISGLDPSKDYVENHDIIFEAICEIVRKEKFVEKLHESSSSERPWDTAFLEAWEGLCSALKETFSLKNSPKKTLTSTIKEDEEKAIAIREDIKRNANPHLMLLIQVQYFEKLQTLASQSSEALRKGFLSESLLILHDSLQILMVMKETEGSKKNSEPNQKDYEKFIASMRQAWADMPEEITNAFRHQIDKRNVENLLQDIDYYLNVVAATSEDVRICGQIKQICEAMLTYTGIYVFPERAPAPTNVVHSPDFEQSNRQIIEDSIATVKSYVAKKKAFEESRSCLTP